jgi:hypothetical protein
MKSRLLIVIVILTVVAVSILFTNLRTASERKKQAEMVFREYANALVARDYSRAFSLTSEPFREALPFEGYSAKQRELEEQYGSLQDIRFGNTYVHGKGSPMRWIAIIEAHERYQRLELVFACELHFDNNSWRLFGCKQI